MRNRVKAWDTIWVFYNRSIMRALMILLLPTSKNFMCTKSNSKNKSVAMLINLLACISKIFSLLSTPL